MMRRLECAELVRIDSVCKDSGPAIRYCVYQARVKGLECWRAARDFYARLQEPPGAEDQLVDEVRCRASHSISFTIHPRGRVNGKARPGPTAQTFA